MEQLHRTSTSDDDASLQEEKKDEEVTTRRQDDNEEETKNDEKKDFEELIRRHLGVTIDIITTANTTNWNELGVTSTKAVELRHALAAQYRITLPVDCFGKYPTVDSLQSFIFHGNLKRGIPIKIRLSELDYFGAMRSSPPTWTTMIMTHLLQGIGCSSLLILFVLPIILVWFVGQMLSEKENRFMYYPFLFPFWMLSFSIIVILVKWVVIGRYRKDTIIMEVPYSMEYLRWWFVDRIIHLWEIWVGFYLKETILLWFFYHCMGADIHPSVKLSSFIREFDLITIDEGSSIESVIHCRQFSLKRKYEAMMKERGGNNDDDDIDFMIGSKEKKKDDDYDEENVNFMIGSKRNNDNTYYNNFRSPTIHFRSVYVEMDSRVRGMLSPGVHVGEGAYIEKYAVVPEGGQVPDGMVVTGNPGVVTTMREESIHPQEYYPMTKSSTNDWKILALLKFLWLIVELYLVSVAFTLSQVVLNNYLPLLSISDDDNWRYSRLLYWFLVILQAAFYSLIIGIALKWIIIGRRRAGTSIIQRKRRRRSCHCGWSELYNNEVSKTIREWIVDYHYKICIQILIPFSYNSRIWNIMLMMYGMDIDFSSRVYIDDFVPSKLDLISIKNSFVSTFSYDIKENSDDELQRINISGSSIGIGVHLGPGIDISNNVIPPYTNVRESIIKEIKHSESTSLQHLLFQTELTNALLYALYTFFFFVVCLIPPYEIWIGPLQPTNVIGALSTLALILFIQGILWCALLRIIQILTFACRWNSGVCNDWYYNSIADDNTSMSITGFLTNTEKTTKLPRNYMPLYMIYHSTCYTLHQYSLLSVLWGTPFAIIVLRFLLGARVRGWRSLIMSMGTYDHPFLVIEDGTIVDMSVIITGHYATFAHMTIGESYVSGLLHQGASALANSSGAKLGTKSMRGSSRPKKLSLSLSSSNFLNNYLLVAQEKESRPWRLITNNDDDDPESETKPYYDYVDQLSSSSFDSDDDPENETKTFNADQLSVASSNSEYDPESESKPFGADKLTSLDRMASTMSTRSAMRKKRRSSIQSRRSSILSRRSSILSRKSSIQSRRNSLKSIGSTFSNDASSIYSCLYPETVTSLEGGIDYAALEDQIDSLNAHLDEQHEEMNSIEKELEFAETETTNLRDSTTKVHLQQGRMRENIKSLTAQFQEAKIIEENLRMKIHDFTKIRDKSISKQKNRIEKVKNKISMLEEEKTAQDEQCQEVEQRGAEIDEQLKSVLCEIEELLLTASPKRKTNLMKGKIMSFFSEVLQQPKVQLNQT